jgi:hypothetical protein
MSAVRVFERAAEVKSPSAAPTPRPAEVRIAQQADEREIFDLLMLLAEENALAPVNDIKVLTMIRRATERRDGVIGIIDAPDGEGIAASVGIVMGSWWYTEAWHNEEMWSFVHPDYRRGNGNYAQKLIQFSKWWTEQLGMPLLMGVLSTKRTVGKVKLYARNVPLAGALYLWRGSGV